MCARTINSIKFYLDESVNDVKKDKILEFLNECQTVENKLLEFYWTNFSRVTECSDWMTFYGNRYMITSPKTKFNHYMQILHQVYMELKSIQSRIIKSIHFKFENKEQQRIYNYCAKFCYNWNDLIKYIKKQMKIYEKKDKKYLIFLSAIHDIISNDDRFKDVRIACESRFMEIKSKFKQPVKKQFQIHCNTAHTVDIDKSKYYSWIFIIDNNHVIGGTPKKAVYDKMIIPVKLSDYHYIKIKDCKILNTFNLRLNEYGKIEIIASYEFTKENKELNKITDIVGIDIGLKKLITCSDGEIVDQNPKLIKLANRVVKQQSNRDKLEQHLQNKYDNKQFRLPNIRYLKLQSRLSNYVKTDNRYIVKNFLKSRPNDLIIMEDLKIGYPNTYSSITNYLLSRLKIQHLKEDITKYCKEYGINIAQINPAFTSQLCPKCGHVSKENRKTQEKFCCVKCGHTDNADHNASVNIRDRYFDERIKLDTPIWKVKEILTSI